MGRRAGGFTLIELLVVITIIGILVGLLMPGVQAAREAARRTSCLNNVKQLSQACLQHVSRSGFFPTGGWGSLWVGLADQGTGKNQPGGWIYNILPFVGEDPLHDMDKGQSTSSNGPALSAQRLQTALPVVYCPTRRRAQLYPYSKTPYQTSAVTQVCKNDYAINGGSAPPPPCGGGPSTIAGAATFTWPVDITTVNGLSCQRSEIGEGAVTDGLSNTYLVGEKYLDPDYYSTGTDLGDDENAFSGDDVNLIRWGHYDADPTKNILPSQDRAGRTGPTWTGPGWTDPHEPASFGSAHAAGWSVSFCDGSAKLLSFNIDPQTHNNLACRNDHQVIDPIQIR